MCVTCDHELIFSRRSDLLHPYTPLSLPQNYIQHTFHGLVGVTSSTHVDGLWYNWHDIMLSPVGLPGTQHIHESFTALSPKHVQVYHHVSITTHVGGSWHIGHDIIFVHPIQLSTTVVYPLSVNSDHVSN